MTGKRIMTPAEMKMQEQRAKKRKLAATMGQQKLLDAVIKARTRKTPPPKLAREALPSKSSAPGQIISSKEMDSYSRTSRPAIMISPTQFSQPQLPEPIHPSLAQIRGEKETRPEQSTGQTTRKKPVHPYLQRHLDLMKKYCLIEKKLKGCSSRKNATHLDGQPLLRSLVFRCRWCLFVLEKR